ncbi:MAG TPA: ATP-binding protein, partial [Ornithinibacter sp.]|nr:ATP-binding protein [Ornithinibacter sp.]
MTPETSDTTEVRVPASGLVVLVGVSGSGKSSFAREHFRPTEIVSSDACRAMVSDDENDQNATPDAFELLNHIVGTRLRRGLLTVVDATNVQSKARAELVSLARR